MVEGRSHRTTVELVVGRIGSYPIRARLWDQRSLLLPLVVAQQEYIQAVDQAEVHEPVVDIWTPWVSPK